MDIQILIVGLLIAAAIVYAVTVVVRQARVSVEKDSCGTACGCSKGSKTRKAVN